MIQSIYIRDFALIDELDISFQPGLNIVTGQTGAGKSIIVGALNMILGERADTDSIRQGSKKAIAEGVIRISHESKVRALLEAHDIEFRNELILRREIKETGSRAFINDTPVPIGVLKSVGDLLVDLHGQHDHQLLLRVEHHRELIDGLPEVAPVFEKWRDTWQATHAKRKELESLKRKEHEIKEKQDLYKFQLQELESANLDLEELEQMEQEMNLLDNAEELDQKAALITTLGSEADINILDLLNKIHDALTDIAEIESEFVTYKEELSAAKISIQEMLRFTEQYRSNIEFNPGRLEQLRQRQAALNRLQKKYLLDIPQLIAKKEELQDAVRLSDNYEEEIKKAENDFFQSNKELEHVALELHKKRLEAGKELADRIVRELQNLGIPNSRFEVHSEWLENKNGWLQVDGKRVESGPEGCEHLSFYISTNKGESPRPLSKTASGGEISRIMLALKSVLAREQRLPVMIFDEIDTGISGAVAEQVGHTMRKLAAHCQIIAITHQAQIASQAHAHYEVAKWEETDRTVTHMKWLDEMAHEQAVASLISGKEITEAARASAREMIQKAKAV